MKELIKSKTKPNYKLDIKFEKDFTKELLGKSEVENVNWSLLGSRQTTFSKNVQPYYPPIIKVFAIPDKKIIMEYEPVEITVGAFTEEPELVQPKKIAHKFDIKCIVIEGKDLYKRVDISRTRSDMFSTTSVSGYKYIDDYYEIERRILLAIDKMEYELGIKLVKPKGYKETKQ